MTVFSSSQLSADVCPTQASAAGFTRLAFVDHFKSSGTIDLADTGAAGKNWYLNFAWPHCCDSSGGSPNALLANWLSFSHQSASNLSIVPGVGLHSILGEQATQSHINVISATPNGASYNGNAFGPGGYFEICQNWETTPGFSSTGFAWFPIEFYLGTATEFVEVDSPETFDASHTHQALLRWTNDVGTPFPTTNIGPVNATPIGVGSYHTWGWLWKTIAQNDGINGIVNFYMDNVLQFEATYTISDELGAMDAHHYVGYWVSDIVSANRDPANLAWVKVWQP